MVTVGSIYFSAKFRSALHFPATVIRIRQLFAADLPHAGPLDAPNSRTEILAMPLSLAPLLQHFALLLITLITLTVFSLYVKGICVLSFVVSRLIQLPYAMSVHCHRPDCVSVCLYMLWLHIVVRLITVACCLAGWLFFTLIIADISGWGGKKVEYR